MNFLYKILRFLCLFIPVKSTRREVRRYFNELLSDVKIEDIQDNYKKVLEKLKTKTGKIKAVFLVSENQKWTWQSVYDDMEKSNDFEPLILITNLYIPNKHKKKMNEATLEDNYNFFKNKNMKVEYAYVKETDTYLPLSDFGADIVFYQQPWEIHPIQGPVEISKYALSCYVPYGLHTCAGSFEYDLRFFKLLWKFFEITDEQYNFIDKQGKEFSFNRVVCGYPKLDTFLEETDKNEGYIIYAPHHSFFPSNLNFATFKWNGEYILQYAKEHPEQKFVFKPHPWFKANLSKHHVMSAEDAEKYYEEWKKIAIYCDDGDYFDIFKKSKLLITDCSSFIIEYFPSKHPCIHLISAQASELNPMTKRISDCYYQAHSKEELKNLFKLLIEENKDPMEEKRLKTIDEMGFLKQKSSTRILDYIREQLS